MLFETIDGGIGSHRVVPRRELYSRATRDDLYEVMLSMISKGAEPNTTILQPSSPSPSNNEAERGEAHVPEVEERVGIVDVARKLLANRRQVEAIEAALRKQEDTHPAYLAGFIGWFRSGKPSRESGEKAPN